MYCYGCENDLENQEGHYGGCIPFDFDLDEESDHTVVDIKPIEKLNVNTVYFKMIIPLKYLIVYSLLCLEYNMFTLNIH